MRLFSEAIGILEQGAPDLSQNSQHRAAAMVLQKMGV